MAALTRDEILGRDDSKRERVDVPEWGGHVFVRTMTGSQRDRCDEMLKNNRIGFRAFFASVTVCDDTGELVFKDADMAVLNGKSAPALERILEVGMRLNGMSEEAVADMEKNSEGAPSA